MELQPLELSNHARRQSIKRKLPIESIADAIAFGEKTKVPGRDGKKRYVLGRIEVIISRFGKVITAYYRW